MRLTLKTKKVRKGDLVRTSIWGSKLPDEKIKITAWSKVKGDEHFGPYIPLEIMEAHASEMKMISPTSWNVTARKPRIDAEFFADETMQFRLCQETDLSKKPVVKVRIRRYGKIELALRRFLRDCLGKFRNQATADDGSKHGS